MSKSKDWRLNEAIRVPQVRLIGEDGEQIGIVAAEDALEKAQAQELDLVEISPTADPPVCRIMDYGKHKYQQQKREHDQRKRSKSVEMKQIQIRSFRIDPHDLGIKLKKAREFLQEGHRVTVVMQFRARELAHADLGRDLLLEQVAEPLSDIAKVDALPRRDGRRMNMVLTPLPSVKSAATKRKAEQIRQREKEKEREREESHGGRRPPREEDADAS